MLSKNNRRHINEETEKIAEDHRTEMNWQKKWIFWSLSSFYVYHSWSLWQLCLRRCRHPWSMCMSIRLPGISRSRRHRRFCLACSDSLEKQPQQSSLTYTSSLDSYDVVFQNFLEVLEIFTNSDLKNSVTWHFWHVSSSRRFGRTLQILEWRSWTMTNDRKQTPLRSENRFWKTRLIHLSVPRSVQFWCRCTLYIYVCMFLPLWTNVLLSYTCAL